MLSDVNAAQRTRTWYALRNLAAAPFGSRSNMAHGGTAMRSMDRRRCAAEGAGPLAAERVVSG
jgi:hypothetical protein